MLPDTPLDQAILTLRREFAQARVTGQAKHFGLDDSLRIHWRGGLPCRRFLARNYTTGYQVELTTVRETEVLPVARALVLELQALRRAAEQRQKLQEVRAA
jgi:hypothetical protein